MPNIHFWVKQEGLHDTIYYQHDGNPSKFRSGVSVKSQCILMSRFHVVQTVQWILVWQRYFIRPEVSQKPRTDTEDRAEGVCEAHLRWE